MILVQILFHGPDSHEENVDPDGMLNDTQKDSHDSVSSRTFWGKRFRKVK